MKMLVVVLFLSACAHVGAPFQFQGTESLLIGKTTEKEVMKRYGKPFRVGYDSGDVQWTYADYVYRLFGDTDTKDLVMTFDKEGKLKSYVYNSSLEEDKIKILVDQKK